MPSRKLCHSTRQPFLTAEPQVTPVPDKQWPCSVSHCTGVSRCLPCWLWNPESSSLYSRHEDPGRATSSALCKHTFLKARAEVPEAKSLVKCPWSWTVGTSDSGQGSFPCVVQCMSWRGLPVGLEKIWKAPGASFGGRFPGL